MKTATIIFIFVLIIVPSLTTEFHSDNRLLQTTTRSPTVTAMCKTFSDRTSIVDDKSKAEAQANTASMFATLKITGNDLISGIINSPDGILTAAVNALPNVQTGLGLFIGPFVLGFIILLFSFMFLCCCCCCPSCCPSKCCQKPDNEQYTKCELFWPSIVLILALLLLIVASVIGITRASDIQSTFTAVGCSIAITTDDLLNGNKSTVGTYFMGMSNLIGGLNNLNANLGTVGSEIDKITYSNTSSKLRLAYDQAKNNLLDLVSKIPTNTAGGTMAAYTYNHFDGTVATISSTFPAALGTAAASPSGAVGTAFDAINQINQGLKTIGDSADGFYGQIGSVGGVINQATSSMGDLVNLFSGFDTTIGTFNDTITPIMNIVTIVVTAIFGVFIGLGVLSILGAILMTCCDKYSCRYLVYFVCVILTLLGIVCFILAILFSVITPVLYLGCDFLTVSISSSSGFNTNLGAKLGAQISSYLGVCLPGGTGDIINQIQGVNMSSITSLTTTVSSMQSFSVSTLQSGVLTSLNTLSSFIDQYYNTDIYDFSSSSDKALMAKVANPAHADYDTCAVNSFSQDSWVPSLRNSDIACAVTTSTASVAQCTNSADIVAGRATSTACFGCIDSMAVLANSANAGTDISSRYGNAGECANWVTDMTNLWTNYYSVKKTQITPIKTRMAASITRYNLATTGYHDRLAVVGTSFTNIVSTLQTVVSSVTDPNYGMVAGLNCLLLGQDINLVAKTTCTKFFNTFYFLRLALGIAAFGILFSMFCSTCSGVRAFKHSQRIGSILPKQLSMNQQESTMAALNGKH